MNIINESIKNDPKITMDDMSRRLSVSKSTVYRTMMSMRDSGRIERVGGPKGRWVLKM